MNRSLVILPGILALGMVVFGGSYWASRTACRMTAPSDDLSLLQTEYHLNNAQMVHIRALHDGYLPQCAEMCAKIAKKKQKLEQELAGGTNISSEAQATLSDIAAFRAQCQAQMLQHFLTVSQAMPPEEGQRYLAKMQKLTLGINDQMEQSMTESAGHEHHQP